MDNDNNVRATHRQPAAAVDHVRLGDFEMPVITDGDRRAVHFPLGQAAGKNSKLSTALLEASRVAWAGARIIPVPEDASRMVGGNIVFLKPTTHFDLIESANFTAVDDGEDAPESALPFYSSVVDLSDEANLAFRVKLTRDARLKYEAGHLSDAALASICLGLARAADKVLLDAIIATTPAAFSLGAAAAKGFAFDELRALVGTSGNGAAVNQDGALRVAGVAAELTPTVAGTIIGSFGRSAVAIGERITLTAERINLKSDLNITCWANVLPLLPMPGAFWTVGA